MSVWSNVAGLGGGSEEPVIFCTLSFNISYIVSGEVIVDEFEEVTE